MSSSRFTSPTSPTMISLRTLAAMAVAGAMLVVGCSQQRPLSRVLTDAQRSVELAKYDEAVKDFDEYVTRRPEEHAIRYQYGKALLAAGRASDAEKQFKITVDVVPNNDDYLDARAEALLAAGERDELTTFLSRNASERGRVGDYLRLGRMSARMGHPDEAKEAYATAAKLDGGQSFKVQMELARFFDSVGDRANHVRRLRMAYFLNSGDPELLAAIRKTGEIPGPSFALQPAEWVAPAPGSK